MENEMQLSKTVLFRLLLVAILCLAFTATMHTNAQFSGCTGGCVLCRQNGLGDRFCDYADSEGGYCDCFELQLLDHNICNAGGEACFGVIVWGN